MILCKSFNIFEIVPNWKSQFLHIYYAALTTHFQVDDWKNAIKAGKNASESDK